MKFKIWIDCDGVLADFDEAAYRILGMNPRRFEMENGSDVFWDRLFEEKDFFTNLNPTYDGLKLFNTLKHLNPSILTGAPSRHFEEAKRQKNLWIDKIFGTDVDRIVCLSKEKRDHMIEPTEIVNVIIDDWPKHRPLWEEKNGIWIQHFNAEMTIFELNAMFTYFNEIKNHLKNDLQSV